MDTWMKRKALLPLLMAALLALTPLTPAAAQESPAGEEDSTAALQEQWDAAELPSYSAYRESYAHGEYPSVQATVDVGQFAVDGMDAQWSEEYPDTNRGAVLTGSTGSITFSVEIPETGYYAMEVQYDVLEGTGSAASRSLLIDGEIPFQEAANITFPRKWKDTDEVIIDRYGNQMLPAQVEIAEMQTLLLTGIAGQTDGALYFYLVEGPHTLTFQSLREPMAIGDIRLYCPEAAAPYEEVAAQYPSIILSEKREWRVEGEAASGKSDSTLYPSADTTSPATSPADAEKTLYNVIGGNNWNAVGQALEWTLDVPEDGLYTLSLRYRQNFKSGGNVYRKLTIDGQVPFAQAECIAFPYGSGFQAKTLGEEEPWLFYLAKGTRVLRLEVVTGDYAPLILRGKELVTQLNAVYRQLLMVTGPSPDVYRDYAFESLIPDTLAAMESTAQALQELRQEVLAVSQKKSSQDTASMLRLETILFEMVKDPDTIPQRFSDLKNNIAGLAQWTQDASQQPLQLDYWVVSSNTEDIPVDANAGWWDNLLFTSRQFFSSFVTDYATIGDRGEAYDSEITVWLQTGRDQAQVLQQMILSSFSPERQIKVKLQLVNNGALLPAIIAGTGPDCVLSLAQGEPMNYAFRNAVEDLSDYPGIQEVKERFHESALVPFTYGDALYALPESQTFQMLFYRRDILSGLDIQEADLDTWDSLLQKVLPRLQKQYLEFGMLPNYNNYAMLLYQEDGSLYTEDQRQTMLGSTQGVVAFERLTELYTDYKLDISFDFSNRFRTGEMPLAIMDFSAYNQLSVFAPEIAGLWGMRRVPGTVREDGSVSHQAASSVTGSVIFSISQNKDAAWSFLEWWTLAETQTVYGKNRESLLGTASRYNSANLEAFEGSLWEPTMRTAIDRQRGEVKALQEIMGGYYTTRYFDFAFRDIVINGEELRETLDEAVLEINAELESKREELMRRYQSRAE